MGKIKLKQRLRDLDLVEEGDPDIEYAGNGPQGGIESIFRGAGVCGLGSRIFKAVELNGQTGKDVALKQLFVGGVDVDEETCTYETNPVLTELTLLKKLQHPSIVQLHRSFMQVGVEDEVWLVLEFCHGGSVAESMRLRGGPLTESEIRSVLQSIVPALAHLHEHRVVHRDIKCENILLRAEGKAVLADLGSAGVGAHATGVVGTSHWMAPEMAAGRPYSNKIDIWSMGITIIEMAEMDTPAMRDENQYTDAVFSITSPTLLKPDDFSAGFVATADACLRMDPAKRPSAAEVAATEYLSQGVPECGAPGTPHPLLHLVDSVRRFNREEEERRARRVRSSTGSDYDDEDELLSSVCASSQCNLSTHFDITPAGSSHSVPREAPPTSAAAATSSAAAPAATPALPSSAATVAAAASAAARLPPASPLINHTSSSSTVSPSRSVHSVHFDPVKRPPDAIPEVNAPTIHTRPHTHHTHPPQNMISGPSEASPSPQEPLPRSSSATAPPRRLGSWREGSLSNLGSLRRLRARSGSEISSVCEADELKRLHLMKENEDLSRQLASIRAELPYEAVLVAELLAAPREHSAKATIAHVEAERDALIDHAARKKADLQRVKASIEALSLATEQVRSYFTSAAAAAAAAAAATTTTTSSTPAAAAPPKKTGGRSGTTKTFASVHHQGHRDAAKRSHTYVPSTAAAAAAAAAASRSVSISPLPRARRLASTGGSTSLLREASTATSGAPGSSRATAASSRRRTKSGANVSTSPSPLPSRGGVPPQYYPPPPAAAAEATRLQNGGGGGGGGGGYVPGALRRKARAQREGQRK